MSPIRSSHSTTINIWGLLHAVDMLCLTALPKWPTTPSIQRTAGWKYNSFMATQKCTSPIRQRNKEHSCRDESHSCSLFIVQSSHWSTWKCCSLGSLSHKTVEVVRDYWMSLLSPELSIWEGCRHPESLSQSLQSLTDFNLSCINKLLLSAIHKYFDNYCRGNIFNYPQAWYWLPTIYLYCRWLGNTPYYILYDGRLGISKNIISDRDRRFPSELWQAILVLLKVMHHFTAVYHPQGDGQSERTNQTVRLWFVYY